MPIDKAATASAIPDDSQHGAVGRFAAARSEKRSFLAYAHGFKTPQGTTVDFIYGASSDVIVYRGSDGTTYYDTSGETLTAAQRAANARFDALFDQMRLLVPYPDRTLYQGALARALFSAMCETDPAHVDPYFQGAQELLDEGALRYGRDAYLRSASLLAVALAATAAFATEMRLLDDARLIMQGAGMGAAGAWASVIQRAATLDFKRTQSTARVGAEGFMRVILGVIFGAFFVFLVKGKLVFPIALENVWTLMSLAFVAGISERFVPGILADIEKMDPKGAPTEKSAPPPAGDASKDADADGDV